MRPDPAALTGSRNKATKFDLTAIVVFFVIGLIGNWSATQYLAVKFGYDPLLGKHLFALGSVRFYQPLAWLNWSWLLRNYESSAVRDAITNSHVIVVASALVAMAVAAIIYYIRSKKKPEPSNLHGSAHWASESEVIDTKLVSNGNYKAQGVYVGSYVTDAGRVKLMRHDGPEHVLVFAPTRSGKGVGLVIPTLLSWPHSVLVHDIKGENWALTAGWRHEELGSLCLKFDPTCKDGSGARFNPLEEVRIFTLDDDKDAQNIASMIVDPDGKGLEDHWAKTSFALITGIILHVLYGEKEKTLAGVANYLSDPSFSDVDQMFTRMLDTTHDPDGKMGWLDSSGQPTQTHPTVARAAMDMLNREDKEKTSVLSTAVSFLTIYRDNVLVRNTEKSDFTIADLMNHEKPVSLYLVVPPSDKDRLRPLIRLIVNMVVRRLTEKMEFQNGEQVQDYKHRLLLMIDEFPSLGKLEVLAEALAFIAGYGLKAYLITQDLAQLQSAYGQHESIVSNCHVRIAYAPNKVETAKLISDMCGISTVVHESSSYSGSRLNPMLGQVSISEQHTQRPLLTPDEAMTLPPDDSIVFVTGHAPIYAQKIKYYEIEEFNRRKRLNPPARALAAPVVAAQVGP